MKPGEAMKAIALGVAPAMKARAFRKRRHSFNRAVTDGIVHVLNFQMVRLIRAERSSSIRAAAGFRMSPRSMAKILQ